MSFNFGGPTMVLTVPVETATDREGRDIGQRGGDQHYTEGVGLGGASLSTVAATATGGRTNREYTLRVDDRNNYEYVERSTGVSALSGSKSDTFDASVANNGLYPF